MKKLLGWSLFILLMLPNVLKADDVALPSSESQEVVITTYPNGTEISGVIQFDCPVLFAKKTKTKNIQFPTKLTNESLKSVI